MRRFDLEKSVKLAKYSKLLENLQVSWAYADKNLDNACYAKQAEDIRIFYSNSSNLGPV